MNKHIIVLENNVLESQSQLTSDEVQDIIQKPRLRCEVKSTNFSDYCPRLSPTLDFPISSVHPQTTLCPESP
jgi:hypothetical protein